jgi:methylglutaconyl-CoA hydratase
VAVNYATLQIKEAGGIHTITLNRPERRNALNPQMMAELIHALGEAAVCHCGVVVLTGAGTAFCSGMDLENLKSLTNQRPEDQRADAESTMWMMRRLYELGKPTIAAVNGPAIAGGTGLATLCDFTLAAPQAKFGYTEVRIGFIPAIVSVFLLEMIGEKKAKDLLLSGRILDAQQALTIGLVTEVVAEGELMTRVESLAASLLKNSPESMSAVKKLLSSFAKERLDRDLDCRPFSKNANRCGPGASRSNPIS